eukprot:TRINITY_DN4172_c0_g1_i1.p1 TRINITY_DN4172_c0_g1~~TRINITY_DN4172_c0_g1_i1.p1  ORF type:complete len:1170 (+),score=264.54 TRINITY_DN4172_c0_g1_i1:105-3614(+)
MDPFNFEIPDFGAPSKPPQSASSNNNPFDFSFSSSTTPSSTKPTTDPFDFSFPTTTSPPPTKAADPFDFNVSFDMPTQPATTTNEFDFSFPTTTPTPSTTTNAFDFSFPTTAPSPTVQSKQAPPKVPSTPASNPFDFSFPATKPSPKVPPKQAPPRVLPKKATPADPFDFSVPSTPTPTTPSNAFDFDFATTQNVGPTNNFDFGLDPPKPPTASTATSAFDFEAPSFDGNPTREKVATTKTGSSFEIPPMVIEPGQAPSGLSKKTTNNALPQLVDYNKMNVNRTPKIASGGSRQTQSSLTQPRFDENPSSFYALESWMDQPPQQRSKLNFKTAGTGTPINVTVKLGDETTQQMSVTDGITVQDLFFAVADRIKLWQIEHFSLYNAESNLWLNHQLTLAAQRITNGSSVLFKVKFWKTTNGEARDQVAQRLIYHQVKQNILSGVWPISTSLAVRLAAYQLKHEVGDYNPTAHRPGTLKNRFAQYLPASALKDGDHDYIERRILYVHSQITLISQDDVLTNYITIAQALQTFGLSMYPVKRDNNQQTFGVGEDGVLINRDGSTQEHFDFFIYPLIRRFEKTAKGIQLTLRNPDKSLCFEVGAKAANEMMEEMCSYYQLLQGLDRGLLPDVDLPVRAHSLPPAHYFGPPQATSSRPVRAGLSSRLQLLKTAYADCAQKQGLKMFDSVLFQIDQAQDLGLSLERLDLSSLNPTSKELSLLKDTFEMTQNLKLPPNQAPFFEENFNIVQFILDDNTIGTEGAEALGNLLSVIRFKEVHLNRAKLGEKGAAILRPFLEKNATTEKWSSESNKLTDRGVKAIIHGLKSSQGLSSFNFANNGLSEISTLLLKSLLEKNLVITELNISHNKIGDAGLGTMLNGLRANKGLRNLDLCHTGITGKTVVPLLLWMAETAQIRELDLSENNLGDTVGKELVKIVGTPNGLVTLRFRETKIGSKTLEEICEGLGSNKSLRSLHLNGNCFDKKKGADALLTALRSNNSLRSLGLGATAPGKGSLVELAGLIKMSPSIKSIDLSDSSEFKQADVLTPLSEAIGSERCLLEELVLAKSSLTPEGVASIASSLSKNKFLKKLDLSRNKVGKLGLNALANALQSNTTLETLTVRGSDVAPNLFVDFFMGLDGKNITLKRIEIGDNGKTSLRDWRTSLASTNSHVQFYL